MLICIAGPTASGKSALAVALAQALGGEIVSCDSMQVYRRMDIGTAKPTAAEMGGVKHHMLSVVEPQEEFSVSRYCEMASPIVDGLLSRGVPVIVVGGTGLYMDSLVRGSAFAPSPSAGVRERLEAQADALGTEAMLERLRQVDPGSAARIPVNDRKRILRALEIYEETGESLTEHDRRTREKPDKYRPLWLGLTFRDRAALYRRIDARVERMVERGLLNEIDALLRSGVPESCTAMQAIGYKEFIPVLRGETPLSEAVASVQQSSRRYAKRQLTWFRRNPSMHWLEQEETGSGEEIIRQTRQLIREFDS